LGMKDMITSAALPPNAKIGPAMNDREFRKAIARGEEPLQAQTASFRLARRPVVAAHILWIALLFLCSDTLWATCTISAWMPDKIVLGSDSLTTRNNPYVKTAPINTCKIVGVGKYYAVVAGMTRLDGVRFNAWDSISEAVKTNGTLVRAAAVVTETFSRELPRVYALMVTLYGKEHADQQTQFGFVFVIAGFDAGNPFVEFRHLDFPTGALVESESYPGTHSPITPETIGWSFLCGQKAIVEYKRSHPDWMNSDPIQLIPQMIELEAAAVPQFVGLPVALMVVTARGTRYLRHGACPSPAEASIVRK
jgi:hypothetical protein